MSEKAEKDMSFLLYIFEIDKLWKVTVKIHQIMPSAALPGT